FDRYTAGEMMMVRLYGVTSPPILLQRTARLVPDGGGAGAAVTVDEVGATAPQTGAGCIVAERTTRLLGKGAPATPAAPPGRPAGSWCSPGASRGRSGRRSGSRRIP